MATFQSSISSSGYAAYHQQHEPPDHAEPYREGLSATPSSPIVAEPVATGIRYPSKTGGRP
jgi:hypothetical protein